MEKEKDLFDGLGDFEVAPAAIEAFYQSLDMDPEWWCYAFILEVI